MIQTIFIVGPAASGKSLFAHALSEALAARTQQLWPVADTSAPLFAWLAEIQACGPWPGPEHGDRQKWLEFLRANKERYRSQLVQLAEFSRVCSGGQWLVKVARERGRIVTGLRKQFEAPGAEFVHPENHAAYSGFARAHGEIFVYVERPGFPSQEDGFDAEFFQGIAHETVVNRGGDVEAIRIQAQLLAEKLAGVKAVGA